MRLFPTVLVGILLSVLPAPLTGQSQITQGYAEIFRSDDVRFAVSQAQYRRDSVRQSWQVTLGTEYQDFDYQPTASDAAFLGFATEREETLVEVAGEWRRELHEDWGVRLSALAYDGYRGFRSTWLATYYDQQWSSIDGVPGDRYIAPTPQGYSIGTTARWEYLPATGLLTAQVAFASDEVAPGYDFNAESGELERTDRILATWSAALTLEHVLTTRIRTRQTLRLTDTSDRDVRYTWEGGGNVVLTDRWTTRTTASLAAEAPDFEAWRVSQTVDYAAGNGWRLGLTARAYGDTGEIENAFQQSSAAPALQTHQLLFSLAWSNEVESRAFSLLLGPYETDYDPVQIGTLEFEHLYADRDWFVARVAGYLRF